jgi:hypothetical protein
MPAVRDRSGSSLVASEGWLYRRPLELYAASTKSGDRASAAMDLPVEPAGPKCLLAVR